MPHHRQAVNRYVQALTTNLFMKLLAFTLVLFFQLQCFSQTIKEPIAVTPEVKTKIKQNIEKEASKVKLVLERENENPLQIEFALDTLRVEQLMAKLIQIDYSDYGMKEAGYEAAHLYDSLMNKYYKRLLAALKSEDKKTLLQAQKAWLVYRDSEMNLVTTISKSDYSGGGTMQGLTEASEYLNLVKERTIALFEHYIRAIQSE
jgi:uncharacterized protein YecT (DUF1311 family)